MGSREWEQDQENLLLFSLFSLLFSLFSLLFSSSFLSFILHPLAFISHLSTYQNGMAQSKAIAPSPCLVINFVSPIAWAVAVARTQEYPARWAYPWDQEPESGLGKDRAIASEAILGMLYWLQEAQRLQQQSQWQSL